MVAQDRSLVTPKDLLPASSPSWNHIYMEHQEDLACQECLTHPETHPPRKPEHLEQRHQAHCPGGRGTEASLVTMSAHPGTSQLSMGRIQSPACSHLPLGLPVAQSFLVPSSQVTKSIVTGVQSGKCNGASLTPYTSSFPGSRHSITLPGSHTGP